MTSQRNSYLEAVVNYRNELLELLEGMDYCLDWKPDSESWSVREVVYHLLETPPGGVHTVLNGILSGEIKEFDIWSDQSNLDPERREYDLEQVRQDILRLTGGVEDALKRVDDAGLSSRTALAHLRSRERDEERSGQLLLERAFVRHWREHLDQIRTLRETLGV